MGVRARVEYQRFAPGPLICLYYPMNETKLAALLNEIDRIIAMSSTSSQLMLLRMQRRELAALLGR